MLPQLLLPVPRPHPVGRRLPEVGAHRAELSDPPEAGVEVLQGLLGGGLGGGGARPLLRGNASLGRSTHSRSRALRADSGHQQQQQQQYLWQ